MSYNPIIDFLALLRTTPGGQRAERMPGLDFVVAALSRAGLINLLISQTAPTVNKSTTAWFQPASPSWSAEGTLWLWDASLNAYAVATPALWTAYFQLILSGYAFQSLENALNNVTTGTTMAVVQRDNQTATTVNLPNLQAQWASSAINNGRLRIADLSTNIPVAGHTITVATIDGSQIMQRVSFQFVSTVDQLAGVTLTPVPELNMWIIAP